jgi:DNA-binding beta-propeller fold protein YncE
VRPLAADGTPGAALAGRISFAFDDVLTFTPTAPLAPDTTYEVSLPANGIRDAAGNGMVAYSFRFSTGATIGAGNDAPAILSFDSSQHPAPVGAPVTLSFASNDPEGAPVSHRVQLGDGTDTGWITGGSIVHTYVEPGHYEAVLLARDPSGATSTRRLTVTVLAPPAGPRPTQSAPIAVDPASGAVWNVNPDNDSVARVAPGGAVLEIPLGAGAHPRSVALDAGGNAWVACEGRDEIAVVAPDGALASVLALDYGSGPFGIAFTPDRASALVTLHGSGELARFSAATRARTGTLALGPTPRAIAITGDGARALVTRFVSPETRGEVWDVALSPALSLTRTIALREDVATPDTASGGRGLPNYLAGIAVEPSGRRAWVVSKQDNVRRGVFASGRDLSQENTVRAIVSEIDLAANAEVLAARRDVDNSDSPSGIAFSPLGDWAFVTLQGNDVVAVYDALVDAAAVSGAVPVVARFASGSAPQGAAFDAQGRLWVHDFLSRGSTRLELADFLAGRSRSGAGSFVPTVAQEALAPAVLAGKRIFYNASDRGGPFGRNRMSGEGYLSCATCHVDGGHDGRSWDFTGRGEGLRNTTDLRGRRGTGHGRVHWSANFDEIQDFENDIRNAFGGAGFLSDAQFALTADPLGTPKAGRSPELDALAAYVASLGAQSVPRSPFRDAGGAKSPAALRGAQVFASEGCPGCHAGVALTDSALATSLLHDVGTLSTTSGGRLGGALPGIDTPTLIGVAHGAPYLHDGSAAALEDVFTRAGALVLQAEDAALGGSAHAHVAEYGGLYHEGEVVGFESSGGTVRWEGVEGGGGGPATLTLRYAALYGTRQAALRVNGVAHALSLPQTPNEPSWYPTAFATRSVDVTLNAGAANTIEIEPNAGGGHHNMAVDDLAVVHAGARAEAHDHLRVQALDAGSRADLMSYLRELDGSDGPTPVPEPAAAFAALAAAAALSALRRRARARHARAARLGVVGPAATGRRSRSRAGL